MQLGMIGLGRMGGNMTKRLRERGHDVKTYDPRVESTAATLAELRDQLDAPRAFWMMVPAGQDHRGHVPEAPRRSPSRATRSSTAATRTSATRSADTPRRASRASTSSTPASRAASGGSQVGYCLMVGGDQDAVARLEPIFTALAPDRRLRPRRPVRRGALHEDGPQRDRVRPDAGVCRGVRGAARVRVRPRPARDRRIWRYGSVVRSWLLELLHAAFEQEGGTSSRSRATSRTPARAAGRSPRRSPRTCPCR